MNNRDILIEERIGSIARLTMNRPAARNSLSLEMLDRMYQAISRLGAAHDVHVIIIAANGPGFCAGHDLKELDTARQQPDGGRSFFEETMTKCAELMLSIVKCPRPIIAQVHGIATAAGCQLVASCDLALASSDARFATPGVNIGLFCSTPMVALSRNISRKTAMEMLLTGDMVSAQSALQSGLLNHVVETDLLATETENLAKKIADKAPATLKIGKEAFYNQIEMPIHEAYHYASQTMVLNMMEPDAEEGIKAFIEKRAPDWQSLLPSGEN